MGLERSIYCCIQSVGFAIGLEINKPYDNIHQYKHVISYDR